MVENRWSSADRRRQLTDIEYERCDEAYRFLDRMPNRQLYLVVPVVFLTGYSISYFDVIRSSLASPLLRAIAATGFVFLVVLNAELCSLYYNFLKAVWQLWRHGCIVRPPVPQKGKVSQLW